MGKILEKNYKIIIIIICVLGILVRGIYITKNKIGVNQYDSKIWALYNLEDYEQAYELNEENIGSGGHMFYIMLLYKNFELPGTAAGQYYHPPLHHFISAVWLRGMDLLPLDAMQKIESLQIVSFIYSILMLIYSYKILEETKIGGKGKILSMMILNFYPLFIHMSGFVNNDTLVTLFTVMNLYYLIRWYKFPNWKNTFGVALTLALGMNVKVSIIVMILPAMIIYFNRLFKMIKDGEKVGKQICEMFVLAAIVAPLGLWHQVWLMKNAEWGFLAVQMPYEHFSVKDATFWQRWGVISKELLENTILVESKNIFSYVINSSLYCLRTFVSASSYIVKEITILLMGITIFAVVKHSLKKNQEKTKNILITTFIIWIAAFVYFNISMPYSCTMHSRYIGILFIIGSMLIGAEADKAEDKYWRLFIYLITILFSILSINIVL